MERKRRRADDGVNGLVGETERLVSELLRENRELKSRNLKLSAELERLSAGWDEIKRLARSAPRARRSGETRKRT